MKCILKQVCNMNKLKIAFLILATLCLSCYSSPQIKVIPFNEHHNLTFYSDQVSPTFWQRISSLNVKVRDLPRKAVPYFSELSRHCESLLANFSSKVSIYLRCMTYYSKPAKLCQTCQYKLTDVKQAYQQIKSDTIEPICPQILLTSDSLHIIEGEYSHAISVWEMADCDYCYTNPNAINGFWRLANTTKEFFELFNMTVNCFASFLPINETDNIDYKTRGLCSNCSKEYTTLDQMFLLNFQFKKKICTDVFEAMNYTRIVWSKQYKCYERSRQLPEMLSIISVILILPICYYTSTKVSMDIYDYRKKKREELERSSSEVDFSIRYN